MDYISLDFVNKILDVLNKNQGAFIVVFTAILVLLNQRLAKETRRIREIGTEPNIEVYLVPHNESSAFINMVIKNSGGGPARNIKWEIDCDKANAESKGIQIFKMSLFNILHYIPANEEFRFFFGSSVKLLQEPVMTPITIKVSYDNDLNSQRQFKSFVIDIKPWKGHTTLGKPPLYEIAASLKELNSTIKDLARNPPLVKIQTKKQYDAEIEREMLEAEEFFKKNGS
jgi:hypothetical protein